ncbi:MULTISPECIES: response regulator transcription factor [unclassified Bacillus (in: firmicutes)]|uniref:response regulator transcription factor n=1 Tax=unclassified Bacillus (in: firmicutes) TaxID=185979 RepID=UPI000BF174DC|nr:MULTISPECIES: response regulator transcription factor [unclassified Bacillus (in: firmicutes)]PEJ60627.1 DNA-binding response regulator [Bacillus sp. AFS002410]PEL09866.1 DNA-binding response regulator [Bacillus sp. AFS017336]
MQGKVLIVDDEKSIVDPLTYAFRREGYDVENAFNGKEALEKISTFNPDILISDIMMPVMNGLDLCKQIGNKDGLGIILLTAKDDIIDRVLGLEFGADDYITKPFDIRELIARTRSLLRRLKKQSSSDENKSISINKLQVIPSQRKVIIDGTNIELTPKEFDLLVLLISNIDRIYSRDELLDLVWGIEYIGGTRTVDIHIQRLRKKLGNSYQHIVQTVFGVGYKISSETK